MNTFTFLLSALLLWAQAAQAQAPHTPSPYPSSGGNVFDCSTRGDRDVSKANHSITQTEMETMLVHQFTSKTVPFKVIKIADIKKEFMTGAAFKNCGDYMVLITYNDTTEQNNDSVVLQVVSGSTNNWNFWRQQNLNDSLPGAHFDHMNDPGRHMEAAYDPKSMFSFGLFQGAMEDYLGTIKEIHLSHALRIWNKPSDGSLCKRHSIVFKVVDTYDKVVYLGDYSTEDPN